MFVYLRTKFKVPSVILTKFRKGEGVILPHPPQNEPLKSPLRLGLSTEFFECV